MHLGAGGQITERIEPQVLEAGGRGTDEDDAVGEPAGLDLAGEDPPRGDGALRRRPGVVQPDGAVGVGGYRQVAHPDAENACLATESGLAAGAR